MIFKALLKSVIRVIGLSLVLSGIVLAGFKYYVIYYGTQSVAGTAFAINEEGYIVTAAHVIGGRKVFTVMIQGWYYDAKLVSRDSWNDVAILKLNRSTPNYVPVQTEFKEGEEAAVYGHPLAVVELQYTVGTISHNMTSTEFRTSAKSCPGNSGGPVIGQYGAIGVLTRGYSPFIKDMCSYYSGGPVIKYVVSLANQNHIKTYRSTTITNKEQLYEQFKSNNAVMLIYAW